MGLENDAYGAIISGMIFGAGILAGSELTKKRASAPNKENKRCKELFDFLRLQQSHGPDMTNLYLETNIKNSHQDGHCPAEDIKEFMEKYTDVNDNSKYLSITYSETTKEYRVIRPRLTNNMRPKEKVKIRRGFESIGYNNIKKYFKVYT